MRSELSLRCRLIYLARFRLVPHVSIIKRVWGDKMKKKSWEWVDQKVELETPVDLQHAGM